MINKLSVHPTSSDEYDILIDSNINFSQLKNFVSNKQVLIVTNTTIEQLYLDNCFFEIHQFSTLVKTCTLKDGEIYKSQESLNLILDTLLINKFTRSSTVLVALGGGVIGDITGFAASIYQRGVDFIQVPTTLLSQVDSSVGGKTAINHALGKNMIGSFYQPKFVYTSPEFYKTLPQREFVSGMAEVVKYACMSSEFYTWLIDNSSSIKQKNHQSLTNMIKRSCKIKADIVAQDEKEISGKRAILNFGHTFAHAIEKCQKYSGLKHGEAVGVGMGMALDMSYTLGYISIEDKNRYIDMIHIFDISTKLPKDIKKDDFYDAMLLDKKNSNSQIKFILMNSPSNLIIDSVANEFLLDFLNKYF